MSYNPIPPRVWSRVQNSCTYTDASGNSDINYTQVFIPLTGKTVTQAEANYEDKMIYKGNILQHKENSSRLTKSQKYSQLAKGFGPNRKKVYATQSQTYTNPNTTGLQRVNYQTYQYPNQIVGAPNNPSAPFQYNVANPNGCSGVSIQDGGTLVCGTYANPCTGEIIRSCTSSSIICNPASASDVPGSSILCWNTNIQSWFPKQRYVMNNSTDKWPINYKGFVSAIQINKPIVCIMNLDDTIEILWTVEKNKCYPISSFNVYLNEKLYKNVNSNTNLITINKSELDENINVTVESINGKFLKSSSVPANYIKTMYADSLSCSCSFFNKILNNSTVSNVITLLNTSNTKLLDFDDNTYNVDLDMYNEIKLELESFKRTLDNKCCLTNLIDLFQNGLTIMYQSCQLKQYYFAEVNRANTYKDSYDVLHDINKLQQFIATTVAQNTAVFNTEIGAQIIELHPRYAIYINLYGIPQQLNFDSNLLLNIENAIKEYDAKYGVPEKNVYDMEKIKIIMGLEN